MFMLSLKLSNLFPSSLVLFHTLIFPFERLRPPWLQWCQTSELHRPNPKISSTYRSFSYLERCFVMVMFIVQCSVPSNFFSYMESGYSLILIFMSVRVSWSVVPVAYPLWLLAFTILSLDLLVMFIVQCSVPSNVFFSYMRSVGGIHWYSSSCRF